jgi:hypothetical protein
MAGFGIGHARIIGYRSPNGLPTVARQSANGLPNRHQTASTRGFVSSTRLADFSLRCPVAGGIREVLGDCWQTRIVVLTPVGTQTHSPAAQDHESGVRSRLGRWFGSWIWPVRVRGRRSDLSDPVLVSSHITRDLKVPVEERMD